MWDEQTLLAQLRQRDAVAFTFLFESYSDKLYRLAVRLLHDEAEADGVVQDTFMRLIEKLDTFEGRSRVSTWLYRVAYNISLDRLRRWHRLTPLHDDNDEETLPMPAILIDWSAADFVDKERKVELDKAIASLPESLRVVFILREVEELSLEEISQVLALTVGATKVRLHRARLLLRERLSAYCAERAQGRG